MEEFVREHDSWRVRIHRRTTAIATASTSGSEPGLCPFLNEPALELGERRKDEKDEIRWPQSNHRASARLDSRDPVPLPCHGQLAATLFDGYSIRWPEPYMATAHFEDGETVMAVEKWDETGKVWEDDHGLLEPEQIAMNDVFGFVFNVNAEEFYDADACAANAAPRDLFVFDDQLHFVRGTRSAAALRAIAQGPSSAPTFQRNPNNPEGKLDERGEPWGVWNPALVGLPIEPLCFHLVQFIKDVFLDSQVTVGLLSNVTPFAQTRSVEEARPAELLTAAQTAAARNFVNEISGSTRMLAHGMLYVGKGNLAYIQQQIDENEPDSWKGYNISHAAKVDNDPISLMRQWRHDDEEVAYPTFELIEKNYRQLKDKKPGLCNICVHKGLAPGPRDPKRGHPADLPKAARDWPGLNFITYHACIQPSMFMHDAWEEVRSGKLRGGVPDISWTTEYAALVAPFSNVYAEIGTTWASTIVTFPTVAADNMSRFKQAYAATNAEPSNTRHGWIRTRV